MKNKPFTERQAIIMAVGHPEACHAGWLLACDAPSNIAKGNGLCEELSNKEYDIALAYRDYCKAVYAA